MGKAKAIQPDEARWVPHPQLKDVKVRIPKGVLHHPHDIEEDLLIYEVFYPYLA